MARQEGEYLARIFSDGKVQLAPAAPTAAAASDGAAAQDPSALAPALPPVKLAPGVEPFHYVHLGSLAYLGMDRAVMQLPAVFPFKTLKGWLVGHAWRGMETFMQVGGGLCVYAWWCGEGRGGRGCARGLQDRRLVGGAAAGHPH